RRGELGIVAEDPRVETAKLRARLDAEPLDEILARAAVDVERLLLPAGPVEREHQLRVEAFALRMLGRAALELRNEPGMAAVLQFCVGEIIERGEPEPFEPCGLWPPVRIVEVRDGWPSAACHRFYWRHSVGVRRGSMRR